MKRKIVMLFGIMAVLIAVSTIIVKISVTQQEKQLNTEGTLHIVASFYPVYMIGLNITDQIPEIRIDSLTDLNTGCLHDYQLTTEDMKLISNADIMIINGGGIESFLSDILANYPDLTIIDASKGITMLPSLSEHVHGEGSNNTDTEAVEAETTLEDIPSDEWNAHVWLDPALYKKQIDNVEEGILNYVEKQGPDSADMQKEIEDNANQYRDKVADLDSEINKLTSDYQQGSSSSGQRMQAVIFHDAFAYLADRLGIQVAHTVPLDSDTSLSAGGIAEIVDEVKLEHIEYLFTEAQFSDSIASQIEAETDARMYIIDSAVTGDGTKDSYLNSMRNNIQVLREALQ